MTPENLWFRRCDHVTQKNHDGVNGATIKINHLRSIDKKKRIKKIIKTYISKTLQLEIEEKMRKFVG